jgi:hypothetical protein
VSAAALLAVPTAAGGATDATEVVGGGGAPGTTLAIVALETLGSGGVREQPTTIKSAPHAAEAALPAHRSVDVARMRLLTASTAARNGNKMKTAPRRGPGGGEPTYVVPITLLATIVPGIEGPVFRSIYG